MTMPMTPGSTGAPLGDMSGTPTGAPFGDMLNAYANGAPSGDMLGMLNSYANATGAPSGDMLGMLNSYANATGAPSWASIIGMPNPYETSAPMATTSAP